MNDRCTHTPELPASAHKKTGPEAGFKKIFT
jgi:hypothetical protein